MSVQPFQNANRVLRMRVLSIVSLEREARSDYLRVEAADSVSWKGNTVQFATSNRTIPLPYDSSFLRARLMLLRRLQWLADFCVIREHAVLFFRVSHCGP